MDDREKLYPTCGKLYPDGLARLARCEDYDQVKAVADCYPVSSICIGVKYITLYFRSMQTYLLVPELILVKSLWKINSLKKRYNFNQLCAM